MVGLMELESATSSLPVNGFTQTSPHLSQDVTDFAKNRLILPMVA